MTPTPNPDLFPWHDPPQGGLDALRQKIAQEQQQQRSGSRALRLRWGAPALAATAAAMVLLVTWLARAPEDQSQTRKLHFASPRVAVGGGEVTQEPVTVTPNTSHLAAVERVPIEGDVVFYRVASAELAPPWSSKRRVY
ncbi:MAG: hypothetical protein AAFS10_16835 [Myxococcota bacterium]